MRIIVKTKMGKRGPQTQLTNSEKKRRSTTRKKAQRDRKVDLGDQIDRWKEIKSNFDLESHRDVAEALLNCFDKRQQHPATSTPGPTGLFHGLSEVSGASSVESDVPMSGIEELDDTAQELPEMKLAETETDPKEGPSQQLPDKKHMERPIEERSEGKRKVQRIQFDDIASDDDGAVLDVDDPSFAPSVWDISIVDPMHAEQAHVIDIETSVHQLQEQEDGDDILDIHEHLKGKSDVKRLKRVTEEDVLEERFIVDKSMLLKMAALVPLRVCTRKGCTEIVQVKERKNGSGIFLCWTCSANHVIREWCSQAVLPNGHLCGNFMISTSITLSGNNYTKVALLTKYLNLSIPARSTFDRIQSHYTAPVVDDYFKNMQKEILQPLEGKEVVVAGDGRMDSPGHCAKYCTYTMMDQETKQILAQEVVDKRQTSMKSALMEAKGFQGVMDTLTINKVKVCEVVTDAHPQITSIMKKKYTTIKHSYDMWHGAKNFAKKLAADASEKGKLDLKPWLGDITNHFWYAGRNCGENYGQFVKIWTSVLHHTTNVHSWALGDCGHGPMDDSERDKPWLTPDSPAHKALRSRVFNSRFMRTIPYYLTCQSTAETEVFNNHILMYASKRQAFKYPIYKCRCQLAAIDYNKHLNRPAQLTKDNQTRQHRRYSKGANNYKTVEVKVPKSYSYIPELQVAILDKFCVGHKDKPLRSKVHLQLDDPRLIKATIAPIPTPSTKEIAEKTQSRMLKKN